MRYFVSWLWGGKTNTKVLTADDGQDLMVKMLENNIPINTTDGESNGYKYVHVMYCPDWASEEFEIMSKTWFKKHPVYVESD